MKPALLSVIVSVFATAAAAEGKIDALCGADHVNEVGAATGVTSNPDGYFVTGLNEQISFGDPRLIQAVGEDYYLCTRSAATPDMDAGKARLLMDSRRVRYLFVPNCPDKIAPQS